MVLTKRCITICRYNGYKNFLRIILVAVIGVISAIEFIMIVIKYLFNLPSYIKLLFVTHSLRIMPSDCIKIINQILCLLVYLYRLYTNTNLISAVYVIIMNYNNVSGLYNYNDSSKYVFYFT